MLLRHLGFAAIGLAAPIAACWACSGSLGSVAKDAGEDTGLPNSDSAGRPDVIADASTSETDADAAAPWLKGQWDPVSCPGSRCDELIAQDPQTSVGTLQWKPCVSGRAACRELVVDWTPYVGASLLTLNRQPMTVGVDGRPRLLIRKLFPTREYGPAEKVMTVVYPVDGPAAFAAALSVGPGVDGASWTSLTRSGLVHATMSEDAKVVRYAVRNWITLSQATNYDLPYAALGGGSPVEAASDGVTVFQITYQPDAQRVVNLAGKLSAPSAAQLDGPLARESGFAGLRFAAGMPLTFVARSGSASTIRTPPAGRSVSGFAVDEGPGNKIVWAESTGVAPSADSVLFEAPMVERESDLVPHRVTAFDDPAGTGGGYMIAHAGIAVIRVSNTRVIVVNLSTGAGNSIDADPGKWFGSPIWVDDTEVWLAVGSIHGNGADFDSIHRITRASLGPPNLPAK